MTCAEGVGSATTITGGGDALAAGWLDGVVLAGDAAGAPFLRNTNNPIAAAMATGTTKAATTASALGCEASGPASGAGGATGGGVD